MNELVPKELTTGALTDNNFSDTAASLAESYLSRLQLFGSKSDACAEGKIGIGRYGIVRDKEIVDLGDELDAVIVSWRPKALQITAEGIVASHEPDSDLYKKIKELSSIKDSGCMHGPEFLLWIPSQDQFVTFHMSSKTARRESQKMEPLIGKAATFRCHLIDSGRFKWHGPVVTGCSTQLEVPPVEEIQEQVERFQNPPKQEVELAKDDDSGREV
ncbi:hypothetical protein LCGC14_2414680 [marine sediment metagenome]|uniref:Uncharacterized protein n=1 Tax=marine sediment metagenome TaxID=412755 RepID=A0A0F9CDM5_9ZZZZ